MKKIYFLFGIHIHQPVGNFPEILENGFNICYRPFIETMSRHPKIKWSLHCTGVLWDFFAEKHPEYLEAVNKMAASGQLELVTGGYYEPVIPVIPDRDKTGQIQKLSGFLKNRFGFAPRGMWVAERVWEPHLSKVLAESGVEYVVVDDTHFAAAGMDPDKLRGYYISEEQGVKLKIFPISQLLRYSIPFHTVDKNIEYFN
jgi:alpha-amylase